MLLLLLLLLLPAVLCVAAVVSCWACWQLGRALQLQLAQVTAKHVRLLLIALQLLLLVHCRRQTDPVECRAALAVWCTQRLVMLLLLVLQVVLVALHKPPANVWGPQGNAGACRRCCPAGSRVWHICSVRCCAVLPITVAGQQFIAAHVQQQRRL
ncbi:hypothetical protein COO60DRAFT_1476658 [Scenedesmus sp. NREL 46B-D3]|nr:hypothetical protein COO60DRAFT_1476658 [Scenedesmus sp. NREL 46B-D3]